MNEVDFYNSMVSVYNGTGQGVPGFLRQKMDGRVIKNLLDKGLIKSVTMAFNHLPDDETLCLTKGYCVEEDITVRDTSALSYLRLYKGIPNGLEEVTGIDNAKLIQDPDFMRGYSEWLFKNSKKLEEKIGSISESLVFEPLSTEEIEFLIGKTWYKENKTIKQSLDDLRERSSLLRKSISLNREMEKLTRNSDKHRAQYEKSIKSIEDDTKELVLRDSIEDFLRSAKKDSIKIQTFYSPKNLPA